MNTMRAAVEENNLDQTYNNKFMQLISQGAPLCRANGRNNSTGWEYCTEDQYSKIFGWVTSVLSFVENIFEGTSNPYLIQISRQLDKLVSYNNNAHINADAVLQALKNLHSDLMEGFILSLKNKFQAETFDDFLAHAEKYLREDRKMESGVIAGVVFEDTIRRICQKHEIEANDLEQLINALKSKAIIQKTMASRCKTAASVRGTAAHANWDELDIGSVRDTISLTRELLGTFLEQ